MQRLIGMHPCHYRYWCPVSSSGDVRVLHGMVMLLCIAYIQTLLRNALQDSCLVQKHIHFTVGDWDEEGIFKDGYPTLWGSQAQWDLLQQKNILVGNGSDGKVFVPLADHRDRIPAVDGKPVSWVFVPTYNRYRVQTKKQMLIDWADAMPSDHPYVRFIVIRPTAEEVKVRFQLESQPVHWLLILTWCTCACKKSSVSLHTSKF